MLVDGDDMNEPIADAVRSILDGHIVLSRELAHARPLPGDRRARVASRAWSARSSRPGVRAAGNEVRRLMAAYREKADLIAIGAYQQGTDPLTDAAIAARDPIDGFLRQAVETPSSAEEADAALTQLAMLSGRARRGRRSGRGPAAGVAAAGAAATPLHTAIPPLHLARVVRAVVSERGGTGFRSL